MNFIQNTIFSPTPLALFMASLIIFLLPASTLAIPFNIGVVEILTLFSLLAYAAPLWSIRREYLYPSAPIAFSVVFYFVTTLLSASLSGLQGKDIDYALRILLLFPLIGFIAYTKPHKNLVFYGMLSGLIIAMVIALYQLLITDLHRASGFVVAIMFGDIAVVMGLMSLAFITRFSQTRFSFSPYICFFLGTSVSILSASRGGWLAFPLVLIPILILKPPTVSKSFLLKVLWFCLLLVAIAMLSKVSPLHRVREITSNIQQFQAGDEYTSIGIRFELWKEAIHMFLNHPLLGVGVGNFNDTLQKMIREGLASPVTSTFGHAHNDILNKLATEGLLGALALTITYAAPLWFFVSAYKSSHESQPFALAGVLLVLSFIIFGLTQAMFSHHIGIGFYYLFTYILAGLCIQSTQTLIVKQSVNLR